MTGWPPDRALLVAYLRAVLPSPRD